MLVRVNVLFLALRRGSSSSSSQLEEEEGVAVECTFQSTCKRLVSRGKTHSGPSTRFVDFPERTGMFEFTTCKDDDEEEVDEHSILLGFFSAKTDVPLGFARVPAAAVAGDGVVQVETVSIRGQEGGGGECCVALHWSTEDEETDEDDDEEEEEPMELEVVLRPKFSSPAAASSDKKEQFWLAFQYCDVEVCSDVFTDVRRPSFAASADTFKILATQRNAVHYVQHTPLVVKVMSGVRGVLAAAVVWALPSSVVVTTTSRRNNKSMYAWTEVAAGVGEFEAKFRVYQQQEEEGITTSSRRSVEEADDALHEFSQLKARLLAQESAGLSKLAELHAQQQRLEATDAELRRTADLLQQREAQLAVRERDLRLHASRESRLVAEAKKKLEEDRDALAKQRKQEESIAVRRLQLQLKSAEDDKLHMRRELAKQAALATDLRNRLQEEEEVSRAKDERFAKLKQHQQRNMMAAAAAEPSSSSRGGGGASAPPPRFPSPAQMTAAEKLNFLVEAKRQLQRSNPDLPELWRQFDAQIETARRAATAGNSYSM